MNASPPSGTCSASGRAPNTGLADLARSTRRSRTFAIALALLLPLITTAADPAWLTVAVFDFESKDEETSTQGAQIASLVHAQLSADPDLVTVERAEIHRLVQEQELGLSGAVTGDSNAKLGGWLGAKVLVTGRTFKAGNQRVAIAKIIGTETSRVYGELAKTDRLDDPTALADELARKIARTLHEKRDTLVAGTRTAEQRLEALVRSLGDRPRPSVRVEIPERHVGAAFADPAAETEWIRVLQRAGFVVRDRNSPEPADLTIRGEAFSAFGLRRGNLVVCRARVEIRVVETRSNQLRLAERQASVAWDIAEPVAAKAALEEASLTLAERVVPRLLP